MALVPCQTNANPSLSLLGGGGGGGGGGSNVPVQYASTIYVSSIFAPNGSDPIRMDYVSISTLGGGTTFVQNGLIMDSGAPVEFTQWGEVLFNDGLGQITGVSTINGVPYVPAQKSVSTITTGGGWFGNARANLNPVGPMTVVPDKTYLASMSFLDFSFLPQPNATDNFTISIADATGGSYLGNFNCAQISTARGTNIERGFSVSGPYEAISTSANFVFQPSSNISCSTFITTVGNGWLTPLN